jgi:hypothetical protein
MCLSRGSTLHERWIGYVRTDAPSGQYCSQARMLPAPSWAGAGDHAAGRHQHAGTEDGGDSQGEAQPPQPNRRVIRTSCDQFIEKGAKGEPEGSGLYVEIAAHRQLSEAHIDPVDVSQEVAQNGERQQAHINLAHGRFSIAPSNPFFSFVGPPWRPTGGRRRRCGRLVDCCKRRSPDIGSPPSHQTTRE